MVMVCRDTGSPRPEYPKADIDKDDAATQPEKRLPDEKECGNQGQTECRYGSIERIGCCHPESRYDAMQSPAGKRSLDTDQCEGTHRCRKCTTDQESLDKEAGFHIAPEVVYVMVVNRCSRWRDGYSVRRTWMFIVICYLVFSDSKMIHNPWREIVAPGFLPAPPATRSHECMRQP